ncbi:MAG: heavy-metal-associated domain-containing protein [Candidatus Eisenbacteria sp.]|nr:heavy-metal-associated domain-containing protein [Candidatus Eisenbacteria bacterium]
MKTIIEIDCGDIPPGCGLACGACIQEIRETVEAMDGVLGFAKHLDDLIEIEHDPQKVSPQDLIEALSKLPTAHEGFFQLTLIESRTENQADAPGSRTSA